MKFKNENISGNRKQNFEVCNCKIQEKFVNCQQILDITDNIRRNYEQF